MHNPLSTRTISSIPQSRSHHSHNKWLWDFSTLFTLSCFLLALVGPGSGGSSVAQSLTATAIENDTLGKVRNKVGSSLTSGGGSSGSGVFGNVVGPSRPGKSGGNSITSNELNHPYTFNAVDDEDAGYDDEDFDEDDSSYTYDSFENVNSTDDIDFIKEHDKLDEDDHQHHLDEKPVLGKCCRIGEGLNLRGGCDKIHGNNLFHNDQ